MGHRHKSMAAMEPRQQLSGMSSRNVGVFIATCGLHAVAIYWLATVVITNRSPLWDALEVSFIPAEQPTEPPPPKAIPVLLSDAFAERPVMDIPPPTVELATAPEASEAIHVPPPDPTPKIDSAPEPEQGYGPLSKPQVICIAGAPRADQTRLARHKTKMILIAMNFLR